MFYPKFLIRIELFTKQNSVCIYMEMFAWVGYSRIHSLEKLKLLTSKSHYCASRAWIKAARIASAAESPRLHSN